MRLWHISDCRKRGSFGIFVNGHVEHPYGVPGLDCPGCDKWATLDKLPIECPAEIRKEIEAARAKQPCMPWRDFQHYRDRWESVLQRHGATIRLEPGNDFWPTVWRIPSRPKYHFFWGIRETIISTQIAKLIEEHSISGAAISPVVMKVCGTLDPDDSIPDGILHRMVVESDLLDLCPLVDDHAVYGTFYSMLTLKSSYEALLAKHASHLDVCTVCGSKELPEAAKGEYEMIEAEYRERRNLPIEYTVPCDVFRSHIYRGGIVVSDRFFHLLDESHLQNCEVCELTVVDESFSPGPIAILGATSRVISNDTTPAADTEQRTDDAAAVDDVSSEQVMLPRPDERANQAATNEETVQEWSPMCFVSATADVGEAHNPVRWMLRRMPELEPSNCGLGEMQFSGWLFMTGEEVGEESKRVGMYYLENILKHDPAIIPYLTTSAPCRLERDEDLPIFFQVAFDY